jgi:hypothetical protein
MKLNSSPSGTPSWRKRRAMGESALSRMRNPARIPAMLAGERRKILRGPDCSEQALMRRARNSGRCWPFFIAEDHFEAASGIFQMQVVWILQEKWHFSITRRLSSWRTTSRRGRRDVCRPQTELHGRTAGDLLAHWFCLEPWVTWPTGWPPMWVVGKIPSHQRRDRTRLALMRAQNWRRLPARTDRSSC